MRAEDISLRKVRIQRLTMCPGLQGGFSLCRFDKPEDEALLWPMLLCFRGGEFLFCKVPRHRPFVGLVTVKWRRKECGAMAQWCWQGKTKVLRGKLLPLLQWAQKWTVLSWNTGFRVDRPETNLLSHGTVDKAWNLSTQYLKIQFLPHTGHNSPLKWLTRSDFF